MTQPPTGPGWEWRPPEPAMQPPPQPWPQPGPPPYCPGPPPHYPGVALPYSPSPKEPWVVPAPPGTPYHRLARTPKFRWWTPLLGTVAVLGWVGVTLIGLAIIAFAVGGVMGGLALDGKRLFKDPLLDLGFLLATLAVMTPGVLLAARLVQRRPMGSLHSVTGHLRGKWMLTCAGVALVAAGLAWAAMILTFKATGEDTSELFGWAGWDEFLPALIVIVLLVPFQAAGEEYVFRGWLLQFFGAYFRNPWIGVIIGIPASAVGFAFLHGYHIWGWLDVFSFAVAACVLTILTGGLEAAIALHVVNNIVSFLPDAAAGQLDDALKQGHVPWQAISATVVQLTVYAVAVAVLARKQGVRTLS